MGDLVNQTVVIASGEGFDPDGPQYGLVVVDVSRAEVERGNVGDLVDRLMRFSDSKTGFERYADSMVVLFTGYDTDPREVHEIPELISYMRRVDSFWPYWYHYLMKEPAAFVGVVLTLINVEVVRREKGQVAVSFKDGRQAVAVVRSGFAAMRRLYQGHGAQEAEFAEMRAKADNVLSAIFQASE